MYSEKQRRYPDMTEEDHVLADFIQCDMAADSLSVNGCVSMPKNSVDICLGSFSDWGAQGCHKFVPVLGGDGTKLALPRTCLSKPLVKRV